MSTPTNQWKLGLFVVVGVVVSAGAVVAFGARSLKKETVAYKTFFDESVQGLDVGSPVKFRGVNIGNVSEIDLAGDKRHVAVTYELGVKVLNSLGLAAQKGEGAKTKLVIPADLRVELASSGITGVKFMQLDFFDPKANPPLPLPFDVPENYIPAVASMMKNLEDSVVQAVSRFPELTERVEHVIVQISGLLTDVQGAGLPEKIGKVVALLTEVLSHLNDTIAALAPRALSASALKTLDNVNTLVAGINQVVTRMNGDKGLVASVQHTSDSVGSLAQDASHVGPAMETSLRALEAAALSVQRLADALELDPDMLIKGRAKRVAR